MEEHLNNSKNKLSADNFNSMFEEFKQILSSSKSVKASKIDLSVKLNTKSVNNYDDSKLSVVDSVTKISKHKLDTSLSKSNNSNNNKKKKKKDIVELGINLFGESSSVNNSDKSKNNNNPYNNITNNQLKDDKISLFAEYLKNNNVENKDMSRMNLITGVPEPIIIKLDNKIHEIAGDNNKNVSKVEDDEKDGNSITIAKHLVNPKILDDGCNSDSVSLGLDLKKIREDNLKLFESLSMEEKNKLNKELFSQVPLDFLNKMKNKIKGGKGIQVIEKKYTAQNMKDSDEVMSQVNSDGNNINLAYKSFDELNNLKLSFSDFIDFLSSSCSNHIKFALSKLIEDSSLITNNKNCFKLLKPLFYLTSTAKDLKINLDSLAILSIVLNALFEDSVNTFFFEMFGLFEFPTITEIPVGYVDNNEKKIAYISPILKELSYLNQDIQEKDRTLESDLFKYPVEVDISNLISYYITYNQYDLIKKIFDSVIKFAYNDKYTESLVKLNSYISILKYLTFISKELRAFLVSQNTFCAINLIKAYCDIKKTNTGQGEIKLDLIQIFVLLSIESREYFLKHHTLVEEVLEVLIDINDSAPVKICSKLNTICLLIAILNSIYISENTYLIVKGIVNNKSIYKLINMQVLQMNSNQSCSNHNRILYLSLVMLLLSTSNLQRVFNLENENIFENLFYKLAIFNSNNNSIEDIIYSTKLMEFKYKYYKLITHSDTSIEAKRKPVFFTKDTLDSMLDCICSLLENIKNKEKEKNHINLLNLIELFFKYLNLIYKYPHSFNYKKFELEEREYKKISIFLVCKGDELVNKLVNLKKELDSAKDVNLDNPILILTKVSNSNSTVNSNYLKFIFSKSVVSNMFLKCILAFTEYSVNKFEEFVNRTVTVNNNKMTTNMEGEIKILPILSYLSHTLFKFPSFLDHTRAYYYFKYLKLLNRINTMFASFRKLFSEVTSVYLDNQFRPDLVLKIIKEKDSFDNLNIFIHSEELLEHSTYYCKIGLQVYQGLNRLSLDRFELSSYDKSKDRLSAKDLFSFDKFSNYISAIIALDKDKLPKEIKFSFIEQALIILVFQSIYLKLLVKSDASDISSPSNFIFMDISAYIMMLIKLEEVILPFEEILLVDLLKEIITQDRLLRLVIKNEYSTYAKVRLDKLKESIQLFTNSFFSENLLGENSQVCKSKFHYRILILLLTSNIYNSFSQSSLSLLNSIVYDDYLNVLYSCSVISDALYYKILVEDQKKDSYLIKELTKTLVSLRLKYRNEDLVKSPSAIMSFTDNLVKFMGHSKYEDVMLN